MKQLFFIILFSFTCLGQEATQITAYRLINEDNDGPCSVASYVKNNTALKQKYFNSYVLAEDNNPALAKKLLEINKTAKSWSKHKSFYCYESFSSYSIHNMITVKISTITDTVYTDQDFLWIIFPDKEIAYRDEAQVLKKSLTGIIKEFFEHDFWKQLRARFVENERDSITTGALLYKGRSGMAFINNFEKDFQGYRLVMTDTSYTDVRKTYIQENDSIKFYGDTPHLIISDSNTPWDIDGIKPGDPESKLFEKYPASTQTQLFYHIRFEDIKRMYYYPVTLKGGAGSISYCIKDNIVTTIEVYFH